MIFTIDSQTNLEDNEETMKQHLLTAGWSPPEASQEQHGPSGGLLSISFELFN